MLRVEAVCPRVAELNPYVHVDMSFSALDDNTDLGFLRKYQVFYFWICVVENSEWCSLYLTVKLLLEMSVVYQNVIT